MSRIEVDKIQQQCGSTLTVGGGACKTAVVDATTVTLGRCGGTVSLASGATQSGFGRTGTVDWITTQKVTGDSPVTGVSGKGYFMNTTAGTITLNLPAGSAGDIVSVADYAATWQNFAVTVTPNGTDKIGGLNVSVTLNTEGQSVTFVYVDSTQGWLNTMDSTSNVRGASFITATVSGACNTLVTAPCCANVKVATFVNPGTFCVSQISSTTPENTISYMVVAGGGSGGYDWPACTGGAGGGAGGFREVKAPSTPYTASPLDGYPVPANHITLTASPYPISVGGGATATTVPASGKPICAQNGTPSTFDTITSAAGGGGANNNGPITPPTRVGGDGGSGGGATYYNQPAFGSGNTPPTTPPQGNNGGSGAPGSPQYGGGGGGGATAVGADGTPSAGGNGGAGAGTGITSSTCYGTPGPTAPLRYYAGGGGGGVWQNPGGTPGSGGDGGGGAANAPGTPGDAGTSNTGGGGGGGSGLNPSGASGGNGGSGIVIIRYKFQ